MKKKMSVPPPLGFETKADVIVTIIAVYYCKTNCKKKRASVQEEVQVCMWAYRILRSDCAHPHSLIRVFDPHSLIRVFDGHSMGSHELTGSSRGKLRLWSDGADAQTDLNLCCMHMPAGTLCWVLAHFHSCSTAIPTSDPV